MRKPVPELSRCCLLLHGSLYDRLTLVTMSFTTGRVLLDDDEDLGLPLLLPDFEPSLARFRAAWSISSVMPEEDPDPARATEEEEPATVASTPDPAMSSGTPPAASSNIPPPSWLLSSSDILSS